jgi:hypothetical protein
VDAVSEDVIEVVTMLGDTVLDIAHVERGTYRVGTEPVVEVSGNECRVLADGATVPLGDLPHATTVGLVLVRVSRVERPRRTLPRPIEGDRRVFAWLGISLAAHLLLWRVAIVTPLGGDGGTIELGDLRDARYARVEMESAAPSTRADDDSMDDRAAGFGGASIAEDGAAGRADLARRTGHVAIADRAQHSLTREEAIAYAQRAGMIGDGAWAADGFRTLVASDVSSGFDPTTTHGPPWGGTGEASGQFGIGPSGSVPGCGGAYCNGSGVIGTGRYGTIGNGRSAGDDWGGYGISAGGGRRREVQVPTVVLCGRVDGRPAGCVIVGDLDKAIIRRYIKRHVQKLQYCYERELIAKPDLAGDVIVEFLIGPDGGVRSAVGMGLDEVVATCVADVVGAIEFPRSNIGASTRVTYPFTFRPSGGQGTTRAGDGAFVR